MIMIGNARESTACASSFAIVELAMGMDKPSLFLLIGYSFATACTEWKHTYGPCCCSAELLLEHGLWKHKALHQLPLTCPTTTQPLP